MTELFQFVNGTLVPTNLSGGETVVQSGNTVGQAIPTNLRSVGEKSRPRSRGSDLPAQNLFDGETYSPRLDEARLTGQLRRVRDLMSDSVWRTLSDISKALGDPEASISSRLRDLRKPRFGMFTVERRRKNLGTWEYRLL